MMESYVIPAQPGFYLATLVPPLDEPMWVKVETQVIVAWHIHTHLDDNGFHVCGPAQPVGCFDLADEDSDLHGILRPDGSIEIDGPLEFRNVEEWAAHVKAKRSTSKIK